MVLQTKKYYLAQYFQYRMDYKKAKAEFVSDQELLKLVLPVLRENDFWAMANIYLLRCLSHR